MLSAAQYLHTQHILHLDLRSENMIITEYNLLKVVDLGSAQSLTQERVLPLENFKDYVETMGMQFRHRPDLGCGEPPPPPGPTNTQLSTVLSPAPELLEGQGAVPQTDIWAIGVTAFIM